MTVACAQLVDVSVTPWYHVISKTVRGAFHGQAPRHRVITSRDLFA